MIKRFKFNSLIDFILNVLLPYSYLYKKGYIQGREDSGYYQGFVDGQKYMYEELNKDYENRY